MDKKDCFITEIPPFVIDLLSEEDLDNLSRAFGKEIKDMYLKNLALLSDIRKDDDCEEKIFECAPNPNQHSLTDIPRECSVITAVYIPQDQLVGCCLYTDSETLEWNKIIGIERIDDLSSQISIHDTLLETNSLEYVNNFSESVTIEGKEYTQIVPEYPFVYCNGSSQLSKFSKDGVIDSIYVQGIILSKQIHKRLYDEMVISQRTITNRRLVFSREYVQNANNRRKNVRGFCIT